MKTFVAVQGKPTKTNETAELESYKTIVKQALSGDDGAKAQFIAELRHAQSDGVRYHWLMAIWFGLECDWWMERVVSLYERLGEVVPDDVKRIANISKEV